MVSRSKLKKQQTTQQNKAKHKKAVKVGSCESNVESPQEAKPWRMSGTCLDAPDTLLWIHHIVDTFIALFFPVLTWQ